MIPIAKPVLGEEEAAAARDAILSGWVTQGPRVAEFERQFARRVGAAHAAAVSSCTAALHLVLLAVGAAPGDVVATVSHSFIATANAVRACGAEPVFVDIGPAGYNMTPDGLTRFLEQEFDSTDGGLYFRKPERLAGAGSPLRPTLPDSGRSRRLAAVLAVHQMGFPCDIGQIAATAETLGVPVVEDAACAIGSELDAGPDRGMEPVGRPHSRAACFSFHPRKILTTGDGGMVTTDDPEIDRNIRLLRQHGMSVPDTVRHGSNRVIFEEYVVSGHNYRMTDIQAAVGIEQLKRLDALVAERRLQAKRYERLLSGIEAVKIVSPPPTVKPNWQSYPVRLSGLAPGAQSAIMQEMLDRGVATRRGIMNAHQEPAYRDAMWELPKSEAARDETLLLPIYSGLSEADQERVAAALAAAVEKVQR